MWVATSRSAIGTDIASKRSAGNEFPCAFSELTPRDANAWHLKLQLERSEATCSHSLSRQPHLHPPHLESHAGFLFDASVRRAEPRTPHELVRFCFFEAVHPAGAKHHRAAGVAMSVSHRGAAFGMCQSGLRSMVLPGRRLLPSFPTSVLCLSQAFSATAFSLRPPLPSRLSPLSSRSLTLRPLR